MKNWQINLKKAEDNFDWLCAINIYDDTISSKLSCSEKMNLVLRLMFTINYCILECNSSTDDYLYGKKVIKKIFNQSFENFKDNADYLFCLHVITRLNEDMFDMDFEKPNLFLNKAIELNPNFDLYRYWNVRYRKKINIDSNFLWSQFITNWKEDKGLLGTYVVDWLRSKFPSLARESGS